MINRNIVKNLNAHFDNMVPRCLEYTKQHNAAGRPVVGIMCEYTPRELIMAAGGIPVCLCGGSAQMAESGNSILPANLCPLIRSTYGYLLEKSNPFLEMADLVVAETTCDGKKKMFELMGQEKDMYVLELPQKERNQKSFEFWYEQICEFKCFLEDRYHVKIDRKRLKKSVDTMNLDRRLKRSLAKFMKDKNPPFSGCDLLNYKSIISAMPEDHKIIENALGKIKPFQREQKNGDIRVLLTGVPIPHGAERIATNIEEAGGIIVAMENCSGLKPNLLDVNDSDNLLYSIAEKYYRLGCSVMTPNKQRFEILENLAADYQPDCIIELIWQNCITYEVESVLIKKWAESDMKIPYLRIGTDYSPSDSARIKMRIEALFETVRSR